MKTMRWFGVGAMLVVTASACGSDDDTSPGAMTDAGADGAGADAARAPGCEVCAAEAACAIDAATASCTCVSGYVGDGTTAGTGCKDIDECTSTTSNCVPTATHGTCANIAGGFTCGCAAGYSGDGTTSGSGCKDVDECAAGTSTCVPTAAHGACTNTDGSFTCGCAAGFVGDGNANGTGCTDVDECATGANDCDNFTCVNMPGSFRCEGLYAVEAYDGVLARLSPKTYALLDLVPLTSTGVVSGITTMTRHPQSGAIYVAAKVAGVDRRAFGTLDFETGTVNVIAPVDRFSSLAFLPNGALYGATGQGATIRQQLFSFDLATGVPTQVGTLPTTSDGHVICYDTDAALMYRFAGNSMESFSPVAPLTTTTIPLSPSPGEVFGCRYVGNHGFLVYDISSRVRMVTSAGVVSAIPDAVATLFQDVRATEIAAMTVPHTVRPITGALAGGTTVTLRGRGLTGATAVKFGGTPATSFIVVDDTTITAVTAANAAATVDVVVTTPQKFVATWPAAYTFQ